MNLRDTENDRWMAENAPTEEKRRWYRAAVAVDAEYAGKERECPDCHRRFVSAHNRGQCPDCGTVFFASNPRCGTKSHLRVPGHSLFSSPSRDHATSQRFNGLSVDSLPPKVREDVDFYVREYGAGESLYDYIAAQQEKYFPTLLPKYERRHPSWTEGQRIAAGTAHLMGSILLLCRGIAKRIAEDDAGELARSASLHARLELWPGTRDEDGGFLNFAEEMLRALSSGDTFVIQRFADAVPSTATSGIWESRLIHNGVVAAIKRDKELLAGAIEGFERWKRPKKYITNIFTALRGLLAEDAALVNEGLCMLLKTSRKIKQMYDIYKVISLETHGLYELCKWYDPELVGEFDCKQGLPWDAALCDWVAELGDGLPFYDVSSLSPDLQEWLIELPIRDRGPYDSE